jgi:hypothetical protein
VGAAKLTGTTSARDVGSFRDAGGDPVLDFADMGWPSTAGCSPAELHQTVVGLADHLRAANVEVGVLEIADGLLQAETDLLIGVGRGESLDFQRRRSTRGCYRTYLHNIDIRKGRRDNHQHHFGPGRNRCRHRDRGVGQP